MVSEDRVLCTCGCECVFCAIRLVMERQLFVGGRSSEISIRLWIPPLQRQRWLSTAARPCAGRATHVPTRAHACHNHPTTAALPRAQRLTTHEQPIINPTNSNYSISQNKLPKNCRNHTRPNHLLTTSTYAAFDLSLFQFSQFLTQKSLFCLWAWVSVCVCCVGVYVVYVCVLCMYTVCVCVRGDITAPAHLQA